MMLNRGTINLSILGILAWLSFRLFNSDSLLLSLSVLSVLAAVGYGIYYLLLPCNVVDDSTVAGRENRREKSRPPVFPNGWIPVAESRLVTSSRIIRSNIFRHEIILFRDETGAVCILDAHCPHLGAHIAFGGEVVQEDGKNCAKCPFHGWVFRGSDGLCVKVPYAQNERPPPGVRIKTWKSIEFNGFVCIWYHADGNDPEWLPTMTPEIKSGAWQYGGRTEDIINCHFQEIPENGADATHLMAIHKSSIFLGEHFESWCDHPLVRFIFGRHEWHAQWQPSRDQPHVALVELRQRFFIFGINVLNVVFDIKQIGPALVVLDFQSPDLGGIKGAYVQAITPLDNNKQRIVHHVYLKQNLKGIILSKFMLRNQASMLKRDILMWTNKKYLRNPVLVKEEKALAKFRQWYAQFYSINSPISFTPPDDLEW